MFFAWDGAALGCFSAMMELEGGKIGEVVVFFLLIVCKRPKPITYQADGLLYHSSDEAVLATAVRSIEEAACLPSRRRLG